MCQCTVLIVDDNPDDCATFRRHLTRPSDRAYRILEAASSKEALECLRHENPDCILLDFYLPDMDGLELLALLKDAGNLLRCPVVLVTGESSPALVVRTMQAGAQDYLVKDAITEETLVRAIDNAMDKYCLYRQVAAQEEELAEQRAELLRRNIALEAANAALRASEKRYAGMVANVPGMIYRVVRHRAIHTSEFLYVSEGCQDLFGIAPKQILADPLLIRRMVHPEEDQEYKRVAALANEQAQSWRWQGRFVLPSGEIKILQCLGHPDLQENGDVLWDGLMMDMTERKQAERRVQLQIQRFEALRTIDRAISASLDLNVTLNVLLDQVTTLLHVDSAAVLLLNPHTNRLEYAAGRGFRTKGIQHTRQRLGEGFAGRAALERRVIDIPNLKNTRDMFLRAPLLAGEDFVSYWAAPLVTKGRVEGVLELFHRAPLRSDRDWVSFLETLAGQAAIAIENAALFNDLQRSNVDLQVAYDSTLEGWSKALDLRDKETEGHTRRVTEGSITLARAMNIQDKALVQIRRGALLHDIGKMGIPDSILLKPGALSPEEWLVMKKHPDYAYEMLAPIPYLQSALDIPYCHHEKWDGSGYPRRLKGEEIPQSARLFAVVDVWDALRSDRPYRKGWSAARVRDHIAQGSGTHFDPHVVEVFLATNLEDRR